MKSTKYFLLITFLSGLFLIPDTHAQHKFEIGVSLDPLIVPVNFGTYVESGPGFYDIHGMGTVAHAGAAYVTYWPFMHIGFSLGAGIRSFGSQIDYAIPDPFNDKGEPLIEGSNQFSARGWGPSGGILFRMDRWRGRIGLGIFDLFDRKFMSSSSTTAVSIWESGGEKIVEIIAEEEAFWRYSPYSYGFLQVEAQYSILDNLFVKVGFETTGKSSYPNIYTLHISGFTPQTTPELQVLNDYEMRSTLTSFSLGFGYTLGFGHYKFNKQDNGE